MEVKHRKAAEYFDRSGRLFDQLYSEQETGVTMRWVNRLFRRDIYIRYLMTLDHISVEQAKTVLDVGVGGAKYAEGYVQCGVKSVTGVDISRTMLEFAEDHIRSIPESRTAFTFILSDIDQYEPVEKFDVVVAMGFFDYVADPLDTLKRLNSLSVNSVIASFPSISVWRTPIRKLRYRFKRCPVRFFRRREIQNLSIGAGFKSNEIKKVRGSGMDFVAIFKK